jgi:hypothetical protein
MFDSGGRGHPGTMTTSEESGLEPLGDQDDQTGDFASEHDDFETEPADEDGGEPESPGRYAGGLDREGPP